MHVTLKQLLLCFVLNSAEWMVWNLGWLDVIAVALWPHVRTCKDMPNHERTATPQQRAKSQNKDFLKQSLKNKHPNSFFSV